MQITPALREMVEQKVRAQLEPDGWVVTIRDSPQGFGVQLEHELSSQMIVWLLNGNRDPIGMLEQTLQSWEISVVRDRPSQLIHGKLLGIIRKASVGRTWSHEGVGLIARVLRANDLLTMEEAVWLMAAGIPWAEEEEPPEEIGTPGSRE